MIISNGERGPQRKRRSAAPAAHCGCAHDSGDHNGGAEPVNPR